MDELIECKLKIVVVSKENDLEAIGKTIDNLKNNNCKTDEVMVAIQKNEYNDEVTQYLKNKGVEFVEYDELTEVYYDLPKKLEFDYISFIEEGDIYNENLKEKINKHSNNKINNLIIGKVKNENGKYILNDILKKGSEVDIEKNPDKIWVQLKSVFISKSLLNYIEKGQINFKYYVEKLFIAKLIIKNGGYKIARNITITSANKLEDSTEAKIYNYDLVWYDNVFGFGKEIIKYSNEKYGILLKFAQYMFMYLAKNTINENVNMKNKHIIIDENLNNFYNKFKEILQLIDDQIIMQTLGNKRVNYYLLKLKYDKKENENIEYREYPNRIKVLNNGQLIFSAEDTKVKILLMDYIDGKLFITGNYPLPFDESKFKLGVTYLNEKIYAQKSYLYSDYKGFGQVLYQNYTFNIVVPLKVRRGKQYIKFFIEGKESNVLLNIDFAKPLSRLTTLKNAYWNCEKYTFNYRQKSIMVLNNSKLRHIKREIKLIGSLIINKNKNARSAGRLRLIYNITKPFFKKEIWLFEDKIYKGGDNGEYMYTYAQQQRDGIKKYYVLKDGTIDADRFKKEHKKYVKYGSLKQKLLFLNCDILFETHNNATVHYGFKDTEKYFRDLFNSTNVCIQHGLTVQFIPHLVNRINDNLKQFFLASPIEKINMEHKEFAYENHLDMLKITGSPRYDGLKNNDKKQILITPSWRNYLATPISNIEDKRNRNNNFKKSEYFRIYNNLINNKKLIDVANKTGYKIIYLLHPCTSPQIDDFDKNEKVELIAATDDLNYEKILTESSLMVTDYSGVQFDFAYMYKPIVYFHPDELPPSYEEGAYKYETMALGEIVKKSDELVDLLCNYMENNCEIKPEYKERIDKFFKYHDYSNCERIYKEIMKYRNGEK